MLDSVDGGLITHIPTGPSFPQRFKRPYIIIHRVDLHRILLDACAALTKRRADAADRRRRISRSTATGVRLRTDGRPHQSRARR